jgi:ribulose-phosphate 3-epimerase
MSTVCPTVLATDEEEYKVQMNKVAAFAPRVQIDLMDGDFASPKSIDLDKIWWPQDVTADIHIMYRRPGDYVDKLIELKPSLVIIHAEADVDHKEFAKNMHANGISAGICLLADTPMNEIKDIISSFDHVLVFGGKLGSFGGNADLSQAVKAKQAKELKPNLEIGWDGGTNAENAKQLVDEGIDVLNAGGFIQKAEDPKAAYEKLLQIIKQ